ncbi:MAG TPA: hypothetical protein VD948_03600, partial [Rhodothermales bacterium]|nr:hypothetical protein [Rhodothermales bacterium]
ERSGAPIAILVGEEEAKAQLVQFKMLNQSHFDRLRKAEAVELKPEYEDLSEDDILTHYRNQFEVENDNILERIQEIQTIFRLA